MHGVDTNHVLLVGAGFSRNWGGWLASEICDKLLRRLEDHEDLYMRMRRFRNYEQVLSQVQSEFRSQPAEKTRARLNYLQNAILDIFKAMNSAFKDPPGLEFSMYREFSIQQFLSKFDAIFTLNQDLLFELCYNIDPWRGWYLPGIQSLPNSHGGHLDPAQINTVLHPTLVNDFKVEKNIQPIFKLHGSVNWRDQENELILIMGGNKQNSIREKPILNWYFAQLKEYLEIPNTRLMVIGYSFGDSHINTLIYNAWKNSNLAMFIVDPSGLTVLDDKPRTLRLNNIRVTGISRRPLYTTFKDDLQELKELKNIFTN